MSRKPTNEPLLTPSSSRGISLLATPDPPYMHRSTAGSQRPRSGSDVLPRSGALSPSSTSSLTTLAGPPHHDASGRKGTSGGGGNYNATTSRRSTVTSSSASSSSTVVPSELAFASGMSTPTPSTAHASRPSTTAAAGGTGSEVGQARYGTGPRSATSTSGVSVTQRSELRRNKRKETSNYHIQLERVLGLTITRPSAVSMNKRLGLVAYAAGCVVVLYDYNRGMQAGTLACSSLTASWAYPPTADDDTRRHPVSHHPSASTGSSQYWQPWMNSPMATPFVNPLAGLVPLSSSFGVGGGGGTSHMQHGASDPLPPSGGSGLLSSTSPSSRKTDSESTSKVPASLKPKPISCLAFSPDGQYLAVGETGHQPRIIVWDVVQRIPLIELIGHQFGVQALQFSSNSKILVSLGFQHDGFVHVWNWRNRIKLATNKVTSKVNALIQHSAEGSVTHAGTTSLSFITVGLRHVKFWYLGQSKAHARAGIADIRLLDGRSAMLGEMRDANFVDAVSSPDGEQTYLITSSGVLCMLNKERAMDKFVDLQVRAGYSVSLDGNCVVCACSDGIIRLFEPVSLKYHTTLPLPSPLGRSPWMDIGYHDADGEHVFSDAVATLFDVEAQRLFSIYSDRSIRTWILSQDFDVHLLKTHLNHSDCVWGIEALPGSAVNSSVDGSILKSDFITYSADGSVRFWGTTPCNTPTEGYDGQDDLSLLHVLYPDSHFHEWLTSPDMQATDPTGAGVPLENGIRVARVSPNGEFLATGDRGGNLRVHDLRTMTEITYQEAHENDILAIDFTNPAPQILTSMSASLPETNGKSVHDSEDIDTTTPFLLATAGRDRLLHVFDIHDGFRLVQTLDDHSSSITCLRLSPDGTTLVSGSADKSIVFRSLHETETGLKFVPYHHAPGRATVHDMEMVAWNGSVTSISGDRRIYVYNLKTGKATKSIKADVSCLDAPSLAMSSTSSSNSLNQGGGSNGSGGQGSNAGQAALPSSSSLGVVENCSMTHLDLDPSGTIAVASGSDKSIRVYDLMQKVCLARMVCHSELITGVKLSTSFKHIYSTSGDGCILVWRLSTALVKKIESRQQWAMDKSASMAAPHEQAQQISQQDDESVCSVDIHEDDRRRQSRQRSLSHSAGTSKSASHRSNNNSVLPPPLPPPRMLTPSPLSASKTLRHSSSTERQLNPSNSKDNLSVSDLSSTSRRNSEASITSEDPISTEDLSSSDGLVYPDRRSQQQHTSTVARPGTPGQQKLKSSHRSSLPASRSGSADLSESFQVSVASPESLLVHKRLSRTLIGIESTTPTGDRSRANSISIPSIQTASSSAGKGPPRSTTPTPAGAPSVSSSLSNRPAWGRAPLPAPKAVAPSKSITTSSASSQPKRTRQRTTSVISGRISFLATSSNNIAIDFNSNTPDPSDQELEHGDALPRSQQALKDGEHQAQGTDGDEVEDQLSETTATSDMEESDFARPFKAQPHPDRRTSSGLNSDRLPMQSFPDGEDMTVNRDNAERRQQAVRSSSVQERGSLSTGAAKPYRQSLSSKFLSGRPKLLELAQAMNTVAVMEEENPSRGDGPTAGIVNDDTSPASHSPTIMNSDHPAALEDRLNLVSLNRVSSKRTKLQQQSSQTDSASTHPLKSADGSAQGLDIEKTRQLLGVGTRAIPPLPPSSLFETMAYPLPHRSTPDPLVASDLHQSPDVDKTDHGNGGGSKVGHVLASPAFVKSPCGLTSPVGLADLKNGSEPLGASAACIYGSSGHAFTDPGQLHSQGNMEIDDPHPRNQHSTAIVTRAQAVLKLVDQLQELLAPSHSVVEAHDPLDYATLECTKDRLLGMVGCIQGQLWLAQQSSTKSAIKLKAAGSTEQ